MRSSVRPDVPTIAELGYSEFELLGWIAAFVPPETPKAIVSRLFDDIGGIIRTADVTARIRDLGGEPVGNSCDEFTAIFKADYESGGRLFTTPTSRWSKSRADQS